MERWKWTPFYCVHTQEWGFDQHNRKQQQSCNVDVLLCYPSHLGKFIDCCRLQLQGWMVTALLFSPTPPPLLTLDSQVHDWQQRVSNCWGWAVIVASGPYLCTLWVWLVHNFSLFVAACGVYYACIEIIIYVCYMHLWVKIRLATTNG